MYRTLPKYDPQAQMVVGLKPLRFAGVDYQPGQALAVEIPRVRKRQLFQMRAIVPAPHITPTVAVAPVAQKGKKHGTQ